MAHGGHRARSGRAPRSGSLASWPELGGQLDLEHARLGTHLEGEARVAEHPEASGGWPDAPTPRTSRCHSPRRAERGAPASAWRCHDPARRRQPRRRARRDRASRGRRSRARRPSPQGRRRPPGRCRARRVPAPRGPLADPTRGSGTTSASGDRPRRKAATPSTSPGPVGRRWTVEPSRSTTSLSSTVAADAVARGGSETVESISWTRAYVLTGARHIREEPHPGQALTTPPARRPTRDA